MTDDGWPPLGPVGGADGERAVAALRGREAVVPVDVVGALTMLDARAGVPADDEPLAEVARGLTGSAASAGSAGLISEDVLNRARAWFGRFIVVLDDDDLDIVTLWAAHTHLAFECYTTPRLLIESATPGSGKTTLLEHFARLTRAAVQMGSVSSPAMLARLLDVGGEGSRTLLLDEVDRNLDPKREGVGDLVAILNSGYKRGATRPTTVPEKGGGWVVRELPTFAAVALAGNSPHLPQDTLSRVIRVLLVQDTDNRAEPSDWEDIERDADDLATALAEWGDEVRERVAGSRPDLPGDLPMHGRDRERWLPLLRVAYAAGGEWPARTVALVRRDLELQRLDREDDLMTYPPAVRVLADLAAVWPEGRSFVPTATLVSALIRHDPDTWGLGSPFGRELTAQRLGRMLARSHRVHTVRDTDAARTRGYALRDLARPFRRYGVPLPGETGRTGRTGETGPTVTGDAEVTPGDTRTGWGA